MKKITFVMVFITITLSLGMTMFSNPLLANTENRNSGSEERDKYLNIITVNKPQYKMVKQIVKDKHNVSYMFNDDKDIASFKYTKEVIDNTSNMDLFIYSGSEFEPWVNSFISDLKKGSLGIIDLSRGVRTLNYTYQGSNLENPYYFISPDEYKISLYNVKIAIQDRDPQNRAYYEDNYKECVKNFDNQVSEYLKMIKGIDKYTFITLNDDFDYLINSLGLNTKRLDNHEISEFMKMNKIDKDKAIIIEDGAYPSKFNLSAYTVVKLWKYYGDMSFEKLILYNINEISKFSEKQKKI